MPHRAGSVADFERVARLRDEFLLLADRSHADLSDVTSAAVSLVIDIFIQLLKRGDPDVAAEMRRIATLISMLADAVGKPDEVHRIALALCDVPNGPRPN